MAEMKLYELQQSYNYDSYILIKYIANGLH